MARRYHEIKGLAEYTAKVIVSDEQEWKKFLHTAGHMYKYPFREQMLIHSLKKCTAASEDDFRKHRKIAGLS